MSGYLIFVLKYKKTKLKYKAFTGKNPTILIMFTERLLS